MTERGQLPCGDRRDHTYTALQMRDLGGHTTARRRISRAGGRMPPPPSGGRWGRAPSPARQRERGREREREKERERWAGEESLRPGRAGWIEPRRRRQRDCAAVLAANACRTPCCLSLQLPPPPLCCLSPAPSGCKEACRSAGGSLCVGATGPATDGGCAIAPPLCEAGGGGETGRLGGDLASWVGGGGARADPLPPTHRHGPGMPLNSPCKLASSLLSWSLTLPI